MKRNISGAALAAVIIMCVFSACEKKGGQAPLAIPAAAKQETGVSDNERTVAPEVIQAFSAAGLPVTKEGIDPIEFNLPLPDGTLQSLSGLKGNVVFLNFWATWCGPCRMEMPSMEELYQGLKDRGFIMLAVNSGETAEQVSAFMRENKLTFPSALDETGTVSRQYGIQAIPTTYIIDKRGFIVSRVVGAIQWNTKEIAAALETLL